MEDKYGRLDEFEEILNEIYEEIPSKYFEGLNLGVVIEEEFVFHPESKDNDLLIMGAYKKSLLGRGIVIYYGSFMELYRNYSRQALKSKLRETFLHELTHHRESLANYKDLEIEDEIFIKNYKDRL